MKHTCRLCGTGKLKMLLALGSHPIAHRFLTRKDEAEYTHDLTLHSCEHCGFVQIDDPIPPDELYTHYNWLSSWKPQKHIPSLVQMIQKIPNLNSSSRIVEIGCNDGTFLAALREKGFTNLLGIEPAKDAEASAREKVLKTINGYFDGKLAKKLLADGGPCDLFIARQVLEHITPLAEFKSAIEEFVAKDGHVLIEVPDFDFCLDEFDYSAIWEEHVNYFTKETLEKYLGQAGVQLVKSETTLFSGQALVVLGQRNAGVAAAPVKPMSSALKMKVDAYGKKWDKFPQDIISYIKGYKAKGEKVAIYGAGCRASGLINFAKLAPYIDIFFDDQKEKQGKFMPGSRVPILPGDELEKSSIGLCLLAVNAENEENVMGKHSGFKGRFASIHPPSKLLPPFWKRNGGI